MAPKLIIGLRHGEKPANAEDKSKPVGDDGPGLDDTGLDDPSSLTLRGWQRSGALAGTDLCAQLAPGAGGSTTLLVPKYAQTKRHRAYQTVHTLALKLEAPLHDPCAADDVDSLHEQVMACSETVVVCWEHDALAELATRLSDAAPDDWPHGRFDVLWIFAQRHGGDSYDWQQLSQNLLPGDAA